MKWRGLDNKFLYWKSYHLETTDHRYIHKLGKYIVYMKEKLKNIKNWWKNIDIFPQKVP